MKSYEKITLQTYDDTACDYFDSTVNVDMTMLCDKFLDHIAKENATILDLGCGSGRDTKYFLSQGYDVTAVDGSAELCKLARQNTGIEILNLRFEDLDYDNKFDGIWACASLLHVAKDDMRSIIQRIDRALKNDGIFYTCFKNGTSEEFRGDRYYSDYCEADLPGLFEGTSLQVIDSFLTGDVRNGRDNEKWLNIITLKG